MNQMEGELSELSIRSLDGFSPQRRGNLNDFHEEQSRLIKDTTNQENKYLVRKVSRFLDEREEFIYCLDPGKVVIINNERFRGNPKVPLADRRGSEKDVEALKILFDVELNWDTPFVYQDLTASQMINICEECAKNFHYEGINSFFLFILSHGCEEGIYGVDGEVVKTETILDLYTAKNCEGLANKPKIFVFQACRGDVNDTGATVKVDAKGESIPTLIRIPNMSDILVTYPCIQGYTALRKEDKGTVYIQALAFIFKRYIHKESLVDLLVRLNHVIAKSEYNDLRYKMMPCQDDRLTKDCYFKRWFLKILERERKLQAGES